MKVLVTGAGGQLGHEVVRVFAGLGHEVLKPSRQAMDFMVPDQVAEAVRNSHADWVVNCAAYTQVDRAESEPEAAFTVNRDSAGRLAQAVAVTGGRLVHISTDFVFDGRQSVPYREDDLPNPLGVYGHSKLQGEQAVLAAFPAATVLRTAWVYGIHGHNFVKTMLRIAATGKPLRVVNDQVGTPTWAADIAAAIVALFDCDASGVFHYTNAGQTSWHGFAAAILEEAAGLGFEVKTQVVEPIPTAAYPTPATRPAYSVLDTHKIRTCLPGPVPAWRDSLVNMLKELHSCADCW